MKLMTSTICWDVMPCSLVEVHTKFYETMCSVVEVHLASQEMVNFSVTDMRTSNPTYEIKFDFSFV
jgi:hypothetical protein